MHKAGKAGEGAFAGSAPFRLPLTTPSPAAPEARRHGDPRHESVLGARAHAKVHYENPLPWARLSAAVSILECPEVFPHSSAFVGRWEGHAQKEDLWFQSGYMKEGGIHPTW